MPQPSPAAAVSKPMGDPLHPGHQAERLGVLTSAGVWPAWQITPSGGTLACPAPRSHTWVNQSAQASGRVDPVDGVEMATAERTDLADLLTTLTPERAGDAIIV